MFIFKIDMDMKSINISFKGYDAAPLKRVFIERCTSAPIKHEMEQISQREGFELCFATDYLKWAQDDKTIIERENRPHLISNLRCDKGFMDDLNRTYRITSSYAKTFVTGGNSFIGKLPNGEKWMLIGEDEIHPNKSKADIAKEYGIKEENIHTIPQQNYHLDMFIRPIGYPYVLVDNPKLVEKKFKSMDMIKYTYDYIQLKNGFEDYERKRKFKGYSSAEETIEALKQAGFKPIEVAGVFGNGINFLNAIVNKHNNGQISYITNSSFCGSVFLSKIEEYFKQELKEKVENIDRIYFVSGDLAQAEYSSNYMMNNLLKGGGGIHCLSLEEPNFEMWG